MHFNSWNTKSILIAITSRLQNVVLEVQSVSPWGLFGGEGSWGRVGKHDERDTFMGEKA